MGGQAQGVKKTVLWGGETLLQGVYVPDERHDQWNRR
jgi:hypothetical protein